MRQIGAQPIEARQPVQGALIHVERSIDLDLQTVAVLGRAALATDDLDALVALIDPDVVTEPAQEATRPAHQRVGDGIWDIGLVAPAAHGGEPVIGERECRVERESTLEMRLCRIPERGAIELLALQVRLERGERRRRPRRRVRHVDAARFAERAQHRHGE